MPRSAATSSRATTRRTGIGRSSSTVSPFFHTRPMRRRARLGSARSGRPQDPQADLALRGVREPIEPARQHRVGRPARHAQHEVEPLLGLGRDLELDPARERILGPLRDGHRLAADLEPRGSRGVQADRELAVARRIAEAGDRLEEAHDVRRAARAREPALPLGTAHGLERVRVEEPVAREREPREHPVVEAALEHVGAREVAVREEQAPAQQRVRDRRAGLGIGRRVRQLPAVAEGLARGARADAAGQVGLLSDRVVPGRRGRGQQLLVAGQRADIGHARVEVLGAHRVPDRYPLLAHRRVVLRVLAVERAARALLATRVEEEARELEVLPLPGRAREPDERELDLGVAVGALVLAGPNVAATRSAFLVATSSSAFVPVAAWCATAAS
jgi:hypothetical protein